MSYSSLHNHTHYSLLDGYATPEEYLDRAKEVGLKAFAITEHGNQYSWVYFDKLKKQYPEIKLIFGVEFYECNDMTVKDKDSKYFHLIALAKNEAGRKAINALITKSNFEGFYFKPRIDLEALKPYANDLIITTACLASKISRSDDYWKCREYIKEYKSIFPHFYLEMQSHKHEDQVAYNKKILRLAKDTDTDFIITTDSHAANEKDLYYQGRHVQIAHDSETMNEFYEGCYIQSAEEIHEIMDSQIGKDNVSIGLKNTNDIADLIDEVNMPFQEPKLPTFPLPDGYTSTKDYIEYLANQGWFHRGFNKFDEKKQRQYKERLDYELDIINQMGFNGYFLIVWDFIKFAKDNDVMVAAGRGSCAGSLVCYLLSITDLDPIKYNLIFERFLNPERISMPDTDSDVSNREVVINYLINKYGEDRVCQILNFSYITPVVAIQDVGKVLGFRYDEMKKLSAKFVYSTFEECMNNNRDLVENSPQYLELFDIAGHLSGKLKTVSCHAGGVGIVDSSINDYMGMKLGAEGEHVIQVDKRIIEDIGIVKFDILGVQTLNLIKEIIDDVGLSNYDININNPDFENDTKSYEVLNAAMTNGLFQVESAGMKDLLLRLQANSLEDLSAVLALYRPDSMGALEDYIEYKHGRKEISYIHSDMKSILESTYGCMIYQEQLMDIVRKFGGRTYGGADKFRKGIGKKDVKMVQEESNKLYQEIIDNQYVEEIARQISDDMSEKGGYLFNRSHSFSYAVICFTTAYLKTYYPLHFFKALFNSNKDKAGMLNKYILDAKAFDVKVLPPHINKSEMNFSVDNESILFGLSAISGIGEKLAEKIIQHRGSGYKGLDDFISKVEPTKSQVIALIKAGAIPCKDKKKYLIQYINTLYEPLVFKPVAKAPSYKELLLKWDIDAEVYRTGNGRFDYDKDKILEKYNKKKRELFDNKQKERYQKFVDENKKYIENEPFWEFEALQIFINDNPFEQSYKYISKPFKDVENGDICTIVGVIAKVQKKKDRNKKTFAFANIYSSFGLAEAIIWHSQLKQYEDLVIKGARVALLCKKDSDEKVVVKQMKSYDQWLDDIKQQRRRHDRIA